MPRMHRHISLLVCLIALASAVGCYERVVYDHWGQFAQDTGARVGGQPAAQGAARLERVEGGAILLDEFDGFDERNRAMNMMRRLDRETNMPGLWLRQADGKVQLLRGQYASVDAEAAQRDLRQTRLTTLDGQALYENVRLIDLVTGRDAVAAANDLRRHSGKYTLQIGYYDEASGADFRAAAEKAAAVLREEGEQAFYYHGATMSLVTVGLFDESDIVQTTQTLPDGQVVIGQTYSERVQRLRERYPYNLGNGMTLMDRATGSEQPSFLVPVP